jgi:hypothetical protein
MPIAQTANQRMFRVIGRYLMAENCLSLMNVY